MSKELAKVLEAAPKAVPRRSFWEPVAGAALIAILGAAIVTWKDVQVLKAQLEVVQQYLAQDG